MKRSGASGGSRSNGRPVIDLSQLRDKELGEEEIVTLLTKGTEVDPTWEGGIGPGLYRFRGTETCDDGFVYESENELTLLEDGTLEGGFVFKSSDGTFFSPLKGTWNEEGELYWLLPYVDVIYEYSGKWEGNRSKGRYHVHNEPNCFPGRRGNFLHDLQRLRYQPKDLTVIGRDYLARQWATMPPSQQAEYLRLLPMELQEVLLEAVAQAAAVKEALLR